MKPIPLLLPRSSTTKTIFHMSDNPDLADQLYGGEVINKFAFIHLLISVSIPIISTSLVLMYDIDKKQHNDHISDLGYVNKD